MDNRSNNFALLHIIGALFVFVGHFYILYFNNGNVPLLFGVQIHGIGLEILFIISGFLVSQSMIIKKKKIYKYYFEKFLRIYPALFICLVLTILLGWFITTEKSKWYWIGSGDYLYKNLLMNPQYYIPGYFTDVPYPNSINGSLWTLPIEILFYIILPVLIYPLKNHKKVLLIISSIIVFVSIGFALYFENHNDTLWIFWGTDWTRTFRLMYFFFIGVIVSILINCFNMNKIYFDLRIAILAFIISIFFSPMFKIFRYLTLPYILFGFAFAKPILHNFFNKHDYAYGIYLYSFPVSQFFVLILLKTSLNYNSNLVFVITIFLALLLTLLFSMFSYYLIEKPINRVYYIICNAINNKNQYNKNL